MRLSSGMEVLRAGDGPPPQPVVLRYVYPGMTPKNGRVVTVDGEGDTRIMTGEEVTERLMQDGVDLSRWVLRYYHKSHEGWVRLEPDTRVAFVLPDQMRLELALEPVPVVSSESGRVSSDDCQERDGFFGIGIYGGKNEANQGTLWRSAWQLGAAFTFTVGSRFEKSSADTTKTWTALPAYAYPDWGVFASAQPYCTAWVAVEMGGTPLEEFEHPDRAVYVLGSEDTGLPSSVLRACAHHVSLPAQEGRTPSFNVAVTGSLILFDRMQKRRKPMGNQKGEGREVSDPRVAASGMLQRMVDDGHRNGQGNGPSGGQSNSAKLRQGDSLPGGRPGVDSAKPSQVLGRRAKGSKVLDRGECAGGPSRACS